MTFLKENLKFYKHMNKDLYKKTSSAFQRGLNSSIYFIT